MPRVDQDPAEVGVRCRLCRDRVAWDRLTTADFERTQSNDGIGDVEVGLSYQPLREREFLPDLILEVRGKLRTGEDPFEAGTDAPPLGTGFYSVTGLVTACGRSTRPRFSRRRSTRTTSTARCGCPATHSRPTSNPATSPSLPGSTSSEVPGSSINYGIAYIGVNRAPTTRFSIDLSVGVGVTEDSPDMALRFAVPVRFNLW